MSENERKSERRQNDKDKTDLLKEVLTHDERGYGSWTRGMRDRVRNVLTGKGNSR